MRRLFLVAIPLAAMVPASGSASAPASDTVPASAEATKPFNIGFVLYTKGKTSGTLKARWNYANAYSGSGVAVGASTSGGFSGHYHVRYFLENGQFSDEYDLEIARHTPGQFYDATWIVDGKVLARGVGMEVQNGKGLAVGWRRVVD